MKRWIKLFVLCLIIASPSFFAIKISSVNASEQAFSSPISATSALPESYDLRNHINIEVENQGSFGICYAFASLTSLETYLALNFGEYYDFSEIHFAASLCLQDEYFNSIQSALMSGGNFNHFTLYTQKDKCLVLEDEMPMDRYLGVSQATRTNRITSDFNNINNNFYSLAKVNDTKSFPRFVGNKADYSSSEVSELTQSRSEIKNHIMKYGSVAAGIYTNSSVFTSNTINYCISDDSLVVDDDTVTENINHMISIVGWDDNYTANGAWDKPGAYICLNSWGESFGDDGYFYVSYYDYFIESSIYGVSSASLSTTNHKISSISNWQDKTSMYTHIFSSPRPTIFVANIIDTSSYINQQINYIDIFLKGSNSKIYIKFFDSKQSALNGINSVSSTNRFDATFVDDFSFYDKYKFSTPVQITNDYMVVVTETEKCYETHSIAGNTVYDLGIEPSYYQGLGLKRFDINEDIWSPGISGKSLDFNLPLILHTNQQFVHTTVFDSKTDILIDSTHIKNNATFFNNKISLKLVTSDGTTTSDIALTQNDVNKIKITKLYNNSFSDISSNFDIELDNNLITITMIDDKNISFNSDNYLIAIPYGDATIYRAIEIVNTVLTYNINYVLDGGHAQNPNIYTSRHQTLTLNHPIKPGYTFLGWFTDSDFANEFNPSALPYTDLTLYAKYDFASPTIVSMSNNVDVTYTPGLNVLLSITAHHHLENEYNTFSYQWFMRKNTSDEFTIVDGATSSTLTLNNVNQSGFYACQVTINIADTALTSSPCVRTLVPSQDTSITVNISPYIYDMSQTLWNYSNPFVFSNQSHTVELLNLPDEVSVNYTNNQFSEIGTYVAHAELIYDDMNGNAIIYPTIQDLNWQIRKAKITITIDDIISTEDISENLNSMYNCTIDSEYFPSNVTTHQDKLNYLGLQFSLTSTSNPNIKTIGATITKSFEFYDITIIKAQYRIVVYSLTDNNITSTCDDGFVKNCTFTANACDIDNNAINLLNNKNLILLNGYNISYSYLDSPARIYIPTDRNTLFNNVSVYMLKDNKLTKLDTTLTVDGLNFLANDQSATYLIVQEDYSHTTNNQMLTIILIIGVYLALCAYAVVSAIKHKNDF